MKKLVLDLDVLCVESFETATADASRGTVKGAARTEICPLSFLGSNCITACRPSGIQPCFNTQTCC